MNYVTTKLDNGRLGNQMFQIAAVLGTAKKNNMSAVFPPWEYAHYIQNQLQHKISDITHFYKEPYFNYTPIDLNESMYASNALDKVFNLEGYLNQHENYTIALMNNFLGIKTFVQYMSGGVIMLVILIIISSILITMNVQCLW